MNIGRIFRKTGKILIFAFFFTGFISFSANKIYAETGEFTLSKEIKDVRVGDQFYVDLNIDSDGESLILARSALTFDQNKAKLVKVERNEDMFCDWDEDRQSADNENGVIVVEGYCQSGTSQLYRTVGEPEIYARFTFEAIEDGDFGLNWEWSGENEDFKSVVMAEGSPPQNILENKPSGISYTIVGKDDKIPDRTKTPRTGVFDFLNVGLGALFIAFSVLSFLIFTIIILVLRYKAITNYNTVVIGKTNSRKRKK